MPKRNYNQAKRQREASRDEKKAQKQQRKIDRTTLPPDAEAPADNTTSEAQPPAE